MQEAEAVFNDDDRPIDDHPDRNSQSAETHQVGRDTILLHHQKGDQQGERQGDDDDKGGTQLEEKKKEHDRHKYRSGQQGTGHRADSLVCDLGSVVDGFDRDTLWQGSFDQRQFGFDRFDDFGGIGPASLQDHPEHRLFPVDRHRTKPKRPARLDFGDITDGDCLGIFGPHDGISDIVE